MAHGNTPDPDEAVREFPSLLADLEQLHRDMVSSAVQDYNGVMLSMAGFLSHVIEHLHDLREALGLEPEDNIMNDMEQS